MLISATPTILQLMLPCAQALALETCVDWSVLKWRRDQKTLLAPQKAVSLKKLATAVTTPPQSLSRERRKTLENNAMVSGDNKINVNNLIRNGYWSGSRMTFANAIDPAEILRKRSYIEKRINYHSRKIWRSIFSYSIPYRTAKFKSANILAIAIFGLNRPN